MYRWWQAAVVFALVGPANAADLSLQRIVWPPVQNGAIRLSAAQLGLLLEGLDWSRVRPRPVIAPLLAG